MLPMHNMWPFFGKESLMLQSDHCISFVQNHWKELEWEGKVTLEVWRWFVGRYQAVTITGILLLHWPGYPMPPKAARTSIYLPEGQGCGFRPEMNLEGVVVSLTLTQHDGDHQGDEEQEAGTCQGDPDEDVTEEIQLFLHSSLCRNREEERSTRCSWPVLRPVLV